MLTLVLALLGPTLLVCLWRRLSWSRLSLASLVFLGLVGAVLVLFGIWAALPLGGSRLVRSSLALGLAACVLLFAGGSQWSERSDTQRNRQHEL